jgi:antitoxin VapB
MSPDLDTIGFSCISCRIYNWEALIMKTAKIFQSGNSQAVRIPKEFQLEGEEVEIQRKGAVLLLRPKKKSWAVLTESLHKFTDDFMKGGRKQPRIQKRGKVFS